MDLYLLSNGGVSARHDTRVLMLETRGVSLAMTALLLDCTILLVHQLMVHASMLLRTEDQVVLRFDDGNAVKFVEGRRLEIVFLLLFLTHRME